MSNVNVQCRITFLVSFLLIFPQICNRNDYVCFYEILTYQHSVNRYQFTRLFIENVQNIYLCIFFFVSGEASHHRTESSRYRWPRSPQKKSTPLEIRATITVKKCGWVCTRGHLLRFRTRLESGILWSKNTRGKGKFDILNYFQERLQKRF